MVNITNIFISPSLGPSMMTLALALLPILVWKEGMTKAISNSSCSSNKESSMI